MSDRWPTHKDLARELVRAGAIVAHPRRGKGSHRLFKLGPYSIAVPWKYPNRDASRRVTNNVRNFIADHGDN